MLESVQSPLVEPVSEADLVAILRVSLDIGIELVQHRQLTGGLFNTSYYIETQHPNHEIILRIAPSEQKHNTLFDYEKTMMTAEPAIYKLMREQGVPVPDVLAIDATGRVIPRHVILLRYIDSIPMNDSTIPDDAKPALQKQLGAYLRQMHTITHEQFGRVQPDGEVIGDASWRVVFGDMLAESIRHCREHHLLEPETLSQAEEYFAAHAAVLDDFTIRPALIHGDMWDANVLVTRNGTGELEIGAIIDVDRAMFADYAFEAALWYDTSDFHAGYAHKLDDSPSAQLRRKLYTLYQNLFHVFVFGIQIPVPEEVKHQRESIHNLLKQ